MNPVNVYTYFFNCPFLMEKKYPNKKASKFVWPAARGKVCGSAIIFLALFILIALAGCAINPVTGHQELSLISENQEINLGKQAAPIAIQEFNGEFRDTNLQNYVSEIGLKLAQVSHRPRLSYRFGIVNSSEINGFALPGGPVFITRGFLTKLQNEAQLAAVLGHEIGHITARHAIEQLQTNMLFQSILSIAGSMTQGTTAEALMSLGQVTSSLLQLRFSREDEKQADLLGLRYSFSAGYNPWGVYQILQILMEEEKGKTGASLSFLRSHPLTQDRIALVQQEISQNYPDSNNNPALVFRPEVFLRNIQPLKKVQVAYEYYDQAEKLMNKGDYRAAIENYRKALLINDSQALFYSGLGMALLKANNYRAAINNLEEGVKKDPELYKPKLYLGIGLVEIHDWIPAAGYLSQAIEILPTQALAYYYRGLAYEGLNSTTRAIQDYRTVLTLAPGTELAEKAKTRLIRLGRFS